VTDAVQIALISGVFGILTVLLGKINSIGKQVDGRLTQLLEETRKSSKAEGAKEEREHPTQ
jgi:hypothetical protein